MSQRFAGKNIIITGAAGNFGREGCKYFAEQGAVVVGLDMDASKLVQTVEYVSQHAKASVCEGYACDVTNVGSVTEAIEQAVQFFEETTQRPVIDLLWNNAGYQGQIAPTLDYDLVDFANVMNINVTGMFIVLQTVAKKMAQETENIRKLKGDSSACGGFAIVNTASVAGLRGTPAMVAYSSSKAAVLAMTVSTAKVRAYRRLSRPLPINFALTLG